jgi:hypothetical protein
MPQGINISIGSDEKDFLRGVKSSADGLDDLGDALADIDRAGNKAGTQLEDSFRDAQRDTKKFADVVDDGKQSLQKLSTQSKKTGDDIGDNIRRGSHEASEGVSTFRDEARQNAEEVTSSFDGSASSIGDGFQSIAATAFSGFGPAGAAAGLVAAAGIGLVTAEFQKQQEKIQELKDNYKSLYQTAAQEGRDFLTEQEIQAGVLETYTDPDKFKDAKKAADELGVSMTQYVRGQNGDRQALNATIDQGTSKLKAQLDAELEGAGRNRAAQNVGATIADTHLRNTIDSLNQQASIQDTITNGAKQYNEQLSAAEQDAAKVRSAIASIPSTSNHKVNVSADLSAYNLSMASLPVKTQRLILEGVTRDGKKLF